MTVFLTLIREHLNNKITCNLCDDLLSIRYLLEQGLQQDRIWELEDSRPPHQYLYKHCRIPSWANKARLTVLRGHFPTTSTRMKNRQALLQSQKDFYNCNRVVP